MKNGELQFNIEYVGPLAYMQQSNQLLSYNRFFGNLGTFVQIKPEVMDNFDLDSIVRDGAGKSGIPLKHLRTEQEVVIQRQAKQAAIAQEQNMAQLQSGAETAATLSKAGLPITQ